MYSTFSGDILDFYTSGDVAPGMRFKYSYVSTEENAGVTVETETLAPDTESADATTAPEADSEQETEPTFKTGCKSAVYATVPALLSAAALCMIYMKRKRD